MPLKQGKDRVLLVRLMEDEALEDASKILFQVEHSFEYSRDMERIVTKDGTEIQPGALEVTVPISVYVSTDDTVNEKLKGAVIDAKLVEVWEVDLTGEPEVEGKYPAIYSRGYLDSWTDPSNVEEVVQVETNLNVVGIPQKGEATFTEEQQEELQYAFRDTMAVPAEGI